MTVHTDEFLKELTPLMEHALRAPGQWIKFAVDNDRDFTSAARWLVQNPASPLFPQCNGTYGARSVAVEWAGPQDTWDTARRAYDPVTNTDGHRIGRIRLRTPRTPRPTL
jgi:hypothetical protein